MKKNSTAYVLLLLCTAMFAQPTSTKWQIDFGPRKVFIENKSQFDGGNKLQGSPVIYATTKGPSMIYFSKSGLTYRFDKKVRKADKEDDKQEERDRIREGRNGKGDMEKMIKHEQEEHKVTYKTDIVHMAWENANPSVTIQALDATNDYYCYGTENKSIDNVRAYKKLVYKDIYPNIDVEYIFHPQEGIKYTIILHPGADISQVKMKYSDLPRLFIDNTGNAHMATLFGDIIDHAPNTYYADAPNTTIQSRFTHTAKTIAFELGNYDHSRTVIIDPWTTTPSLPTSNRAFYIKSDSSGNAYVYGGDTPFTLQKFNSSGVLQWTYNSPWDSSGGWFGTLQVDRAGNSYISRGSVSGIAKVNTAGSQVWVNNYGLFNVDEYWALTFNCDESKLIAGGTTTSNFALKGAAMNINLANGAVSGKLIVANSLGINPNEIRALCMSPNGNYYGITLDTIVSFTSNLTFNYGNTSGITFSYGSPSYGLGTPQGQNSIRASISNIYTATGATLSKRDINTGTVLSSVTIPGGVTNSSFAGSSAGNGGIDIDSCGNIYVGSVGKVVKYDANLNQLSTATTPGAVYDVSVAKNGDILACGQGFAVALNMSACAQVKPICVTVMTAAATATNPTCSGSCNGTASASATNGTGALTYAWNNSATTQTINNLCPGTYTVTVTDASHNTATASTTVGQGSAFTATATPTNASCGNNNGSAVANVTAGTGPFSYSWSNNGTSQVISGIGAGTYIVTVTGFNNCSATASAIVTNTASVTLSQTTTSTTCGNANGSATVNVTTGTGPYSYLWSNSATTQTISNVATGSYTVTVTGSGGCSATISANVAASAGITASATATNAGCTSNGTATANATSGNGPFSYIWSTGGTAQTITGLATGSYTVTITGNSGCSATASATVGNSGSAISISSSATNASCSANNGSASISVTSGTGPFTYIWSNNATTSNISSLSPGTYTVTVSGNAGCSATGSVTISTTGGLSLSTSSTNANCSGNAGSATVNVTTGTGPFNYAWSNNATTQTISNAGAATYTVTVTGSGGCSATATVTITAANGLSISPAATNTTCGNSNGSATVSIISGGGPYSYLWSNSATTQTINNLPAGTYTVTVTANGGCSATASAVVNPSGNGNVNITTAHTKLCSGDSTQICAPTGYNSYQWNTGQNTSCIEATNPGNYYVTVTDNGNCTAISNHLGISFYPLPPTSISVRGDTLTAYNAVSYQWYYNGSPIPGANGHTYIATQAGNYQILVTDSNGCSALSNSTPIDILGVDNIVTNSQLKVYPNPLSSGYWNVDITADRIDNWCDVYDADGRMVYHNQLHENHNTIYMHVAQGVYVMRVYSATDNTTIKLIKLD